MKSKNYLKEEKLEKNPNRDLSYEYYGLSAYRPSEEEIIKAREIAEKQIRNEYLRDIKEELVGGNFHSGEYEIFNEKLQGRVLTRYLKWGLKRLVGLEKKTWEEEFWDVMKEAYHDTLQTGLKVEKEAYFNKMNETYREAENGIFDHLFNNNPLKPQEEVKEITKEERLKRERIKRRFGYVMAGLATCLVAGPLLTGCTKASSTSDYKCITDSSQSNQIDKQIHNIVQTGKSIANEIYDHLKKAEYQQLTQKLETHPSAEKKKIKEETCTVIHGYCVKKDEEGRHYIKIPEKGQKYYLSAIYQAFTGKKKVTEDDLKKDSQFQKFLEENKKDIKYLGDTDNDGIWWNDAKNEADPDYVKPGDRIYVDSLLPKEKPSPQPKPKPSPKPGEGKGETRKTPSTGETPSTPGKPPSPAPSPQPTPQCPSPEEAAKVLGVNSGQVAYLGNVCGGDLPCYKTLPTINSQMLHIAEEISKKGKYCPTQPEEAEIGSADEKTCVILKKLAETIDDGDKIITIDEFWNFYKKAVEDGCITPDEIGFSISGPTGQPPEECGGAQTICSGYGWGVQKGAVSNEVLKQLTYLDKNKNCQWDPDEPLYLWVDKNGNKQVDPGEKVQVRVEQNLTEERKNEIIQKIQSYTRDLKTEPCNGILKYLEPVEKKKPKPPKTKTEPDIDVHYSENQNPKEEPKAYATGIIPFEAIDPSLKCKSSDNGGYACWIDENRNNKKDAGEQTYDSKEIEARLKKLPNGRKGEKIEIEEITPVDTDQDGEYDALQIKTQDFELGKHKRYLEVRNPEHFSHQVRIPGEAGRELIRNYAKGYYKENGISSPDTPEEYQQLVKELKKGREEMTKAYREIASGGSMTRISPHGKEVEISVNSEISKPENFLVKMNNLQKANAEEIGKALLKLYTDLGLHELYGRTAFGRNLSLATMAITQDIFWNVYEALPGGRIDAKVLDEDWYQTQAKFYHQQKQEQEKAEVQANQAEEEKEKGPFGYPGFEDKWMDEEEKVKMGITWLAERAAVATAIGKALAPSAAKAAAEQGLPPSGIVPPEPSPGGVPAGPSGPSPGGVPAP